MELDRHGEFSWICDYGGRAVAGYRGEVYLEIDEALDPSRELMRRISVHSFPLRIRLEVSRLDKHGAWEQVSTAEEEFPLNEGKRTFVHDFGVCIGRVYAGLMPLKFDVAVLVPDKDLHAARPRLRLSPQYAPPK
jgi:hypothetical protein